MKPITKYSQTVYSAHKVSDIVKSAIKIATEEKP
jgi:thiamine pyrophosphate-dependent acetolactate synthase large subunit-like protein